MKAMLSDIPQNYCSTGFVSLRKKCCCKLGRIILTLIWSSTKQYMSHPMSTISSSTFTMYVYSYIALSFVCCRSWSHSLLGSGNEVAGWIDSAFMHSVVRFHFLCLQCCRLSTCATELWRGIRAEVHFLYLNWRKNDIFFGLWFLWTSWPTTFSCTIPMHQKDNKLNVPTQHHITS